MAKNINKDEPSIVDHSIRIEIGHSIACNAKIEKLTVITGSVWERGTNRLEFHTYVLK